jgi:toxin ParE1/3/4
MSARRLTVVLASEASEDLRSVFLHTERQWGRAQVNAYRAALNKAFASLGTNPAIGRARDDLAPGVRALVVRHHSILDRIEADVVRVLRVVHVRRDASRLLSQ